MNEGSDDMFESSNELKAEMIARDLFHRISENQLVQDEYDKIKDVLRSTLDDLPEELREIVRKKFVILMTDNFFGNK